MELGSLLRVWYSDDSVWHERLVLLRGRGDDMYWILTPDMDLYEENLGGEAEDGPQKVRVVPYGVRTRYTKPVYKFRDEITVAFLESKIVEAWREHEATYGSPVEGDEDVVFPDGTSRKLFSIVPRRRLRRKSHAEQLPVGSGRAAAFTSPVEVRGPDEGNSEMEVWIVVYSSNRELIGSQVSSSSEVPTVRLGGQAYKIFAKDGQVLVVRGCSALEAPGVSQEVLPKTTAEPGGERDIRVLPVLFDTAEERWRTLSEALPDFEEVEFEDFPLQGPRTMYRDARQLRRLGMSFVQHHESWLKKSGVRVADRSVFEHASLCRVLDYMTSYDQLNLPALASAEALNRRRSLIEIAHQGRPEAPTYEAAEEIMGVREAVDGSVVDPALTQHAAKRQAAKAEVLKQTRLAAEERKHLRQRGEEEEKGGKGNGKAKNKTGQEAP